LEYLRTSQLNNKMTYTGAKRSFIDGKP